MSSAGSGVLDLLQEGPESNCLGFRQLRGEVFLDTTQVRRCRLPECGSSVLGQHDEGATAIRVEDLAFNQTVAFQSIHKTGRGAPTDEQVIGKVTDPHRAPGFMELNQGVVPGQR